MTAIVEPDSFEPDPSFCGHVKAAWLFICHFFIFVLVVREGQDAQAAVSRYRDSSGNKAVVVAPGQR